MAVRKYLNMSTISKLLLLIGITTAYTANAQVNNDLAHVDMSGKITKYSKRIYSNVIKKNGRWTATDTSAYIYSITLLDGNGNNNSRSYFRCNGNDTERLSHTAFINNTNGNRTAYIYNEYDKQMVSVTISKTDSLHYSKTVNDANGSRIESKAYTLDSLFRIVTIDRYFSIPGQRRYKKDYETEVREYGKKGHLSRSYIIAKEQGTSKADTIRQWQYITPVYEGHNNPLQVIRTEKGNEQNIQMILYEYNYY